MRDEINCVLHVGSSAPAFTSIEDQRTHFKSDWHRCNMRRKLLGRPILTEAEFAQALQDTGDLSSISGSDPDSEDEAAGRRSTHAATSSSHRSPEVVFVSGTSHYNR
jgi:hypothetical protein